MEQTTPVQIRFENNREMLDLYVKIELKHFIAKLLQDRFIILEEEGSPSDNTEDSRAS